MTLSKMVHDAIAYAPYVSYVSYVSFRLLS